MPGLAWKKADFICQIFAVKCRNIQDYKKTTGDVATVETLKADMTDSQVILLLFKHYSLVYF